ncbi:hypothetical protein PG997_009168 [Apiospora hydei]|uniref:Uncharacterized protein n=1 Tax=Apiospora hydei TaxID=1337664 RepID=A0ABR1VTA1_9PEZI
MVRGDMIVIEVGKLLGRAFESTEGMAQHEENGVLSPDIPGVRIELAEEYAEPRQKDSKIENGIGGHMLSDVFWLVRRKPIIAKQEPEQASAAVTLLRNHQ